ncbi:hypothetical protein CTI12_AA603570 [Artemisia annua]|uniref:Uncharacterized protein n=1 Tax=Artemisia annua TaxID=35608 RepID=A0A2U1KH09_ARTAN|nr:hypothetical protein CTI12_AA603570 [Artemisia annua]
MDDQPSQCPEMLQVHSIPNASHGLKRPRGRPPKRARPSGSTTAAAPKRPRGRPPSTKKTGSTVAAAHKRPRGRPPSSKKIVGQRKTSPSQAPSTSTRRGERPPPITGVILGLSAPKAQEDEAAPLRCKPSSSKVAPIRATPSTSKIMDDQPIKCSEKLKVKTEDMDDQPSQCLEMLQVHSIPNASHGLKRPRGRPPKRARPSGSTTAAAPKRPRGRPPSTKKTGSIGAAAHKRPRGRHPSSQKTVGQRKTSPSQAPSTSTRRGERPPHITGVILGLSAPKAQKVASTRSVRKSIAWF